MEQSTDSNSEFAARLKQLRLQKGFSQKDVAELIGINITNYGNYERVDAIPSAESLQKLAGIFEVSIDYLLTGRAADALVANIADKELLKLFQEIEKFSDTDKEHVKFVLESIVKNKKLQQLAS
jgi:transcriptional regulator with XRE-family HTH domain